jgi:hypothetical protein
METDEKKTSRKRSDYRATPQKAPQPSDSQNAGKGIELRQLMAQSSPCHVPLSKSPAPGHLSETPTALDPTDETTAKAVPPPKHSQPTNYQQQSMSRYLSEMAPTNIPNPPEVVRVNIDVSEEVNQASLSEAEDESQVQGSGNESENPTTPTFDNRRRGSARKRS